MKEDAKNIKSTILNPLMRQINIIIHVMSIGGILHVIGGTVNYIAINNISYKDIEINPHLKNISIKIIQCCKLSLIDTKKLIDYLN